jgi:hypothetical protein
MTEWCSEPDPNLIESSAGFSVRILGRTGMRYAEAGRSVWIDSEVLGKPRAVALFKDSIKTWEGDNPGQVSDSDRDRIAVNIKCAFEFCGYELEAHTDFERRM